MAAHELAAAVAPYARAEAARDVVRSRSFRQVLDALAAASVPAIVFKGEHLAHACYERPDLRPRTDSDVLVRHGDRQKAAHALETCGYRRVAQLEADLISYQATFVRAGEENGGMAIDLHWRLSNPQEFGDLLSSEDLFAAAVPLPALGATARVPSTVHALLIALVHRVAHHAGHTRLIWDWDLMCLAKRMNADEWNDLIRMAHRHRLGSVFAAELARAMLVSPGAVPSWVCDRLRETARLTRGPDRREHQTRIGELLASLRALPGWRERASLARQHLLPPRRYMRDVYAPSSHAPLPILYVRRAIAGAWKYCRSASG